jgi:hypothetical protein
LIARTQLLAPVLAALERLDYPRAFLNEVQKFFTIVGQQRPDLAERSRFATRGKNTVEMEKILSEALSHCADLQRTGLWPKETDIPSFWAVRFNHTTGYLHAGYSKSSTPIFPPA